MMAFLVTLRNVILLVYTILAIIGFIRKHRLKAKEGKKKKSE
jgi:hypothetical protein